MKAPVDQEMQIIDRPLQDRKTANKHICPPRTLSNRSKPWHRLRKSGKTRETSQI